MKKDRQSISVEISRIVRKNSLCIVRRIRIASPLTSGYTSLLPYFCLLNRGVGTTRGGGAMARKINEGSEI